MKVGVFTATDDVIPFKDFVNLVGLMVILSNKIYIEQSIKKKQDRRYHLMQGELKAYSDSVKAYLKKESGIKRTICNYILEKFEIDQDLWNRSSDYYFNN